MEMIPSHLSFSTYSQWTRCQKAYQLGKIVEAPAKPALYFAGGSAIHHATEDHDREDRVMGTWESYFYPEMSKLMEESNGLYWDVKTWLSGGPVNDPETPEDWMTIGPQCIDNWISFVKNEFAVASIELDVTGILPGCPVPIKGFVDRTGIHNSHGPLIIDIKNGKSKPKDSFQLGTYHALMEAKGIDVPLNGAYFMGREGRIIGKPVDLSEYTPEAVGKVYGEIYKEMVKAEKKDRYPARKEFNCKWCTVQDNCLAYLGETKQAKRFDPYYGKGIVSF
jgi:hypothetical protein